MDIALLFVGVATGVVAGIAGAGLLGRRLRADVAVERLEAEAVRDAAVAEAVAQLTGQLTGQLAVEREQTLQLLVQQFASEREQSLHAAVDTVVTVATDKLGAHTELASRELGLRSQSIDDKVAGMNAELHRVSQLVADLQVDKARQHGEIVQSIGEAVRASSSLRDTAQSLREALSNSRARGQWGERLADDVLRTAGFVEGVSYRKQVTLPGGGRPDVTFLLPRDRVLHMDVKFPLDNYLRHLEAATDHERDAATKAFLRDVRARVKELSVRDYIDPDQTVGYVLLFIPNEAVYAFVHEHDAQLLDDALAQQVVLCSPCTLFAVLGVVRQAVDTFLLSRTSDEILECLNGFTKQWTAFSDKLDRLGNQFATAQRSYDELAGTRRRAMQKQLDQVERLRTTRGTLELPAENEENEEDDEVVTASVSGADGREGPAIDRSVVSTVSGEALVAHPTSALRVPRLRPLRAG